MLYVMPCITTKYIFVAIKFFPDDNALVLYHGGTAELAISTEPSDVFHQSFATAVASKLVSDSQSILLAADDVVDTSTNDDTSGTGGRLTVSDRVW